MRRQVGANGIPSYGFGDGGYVKCFATGHGISPKDNRIPLRRIRSCRHGRHEQVIIRAFQCHNCDDHHGRHEQVIIRAFQCHNCDGPRKAPGDFPDEDGAGSLPQQDSAKFNSCLANSKSAKASYCHYAVG
jgi:hypothetical protein